MCWLKKRWLVTALRSFLGLFLLVFGLNGFFQFMPPPPMEGLGGEFITILMTSGFVYVVSALEVLIGIMLLLNWRTPFAALLLAPLSVNFILYHILFDFATIAGAAIVLVLNIYLGYVHFDAYRSVFRK